MLNGKLMTEKLEDLFGQYLLLDGGVSLGRTISQFRNRYMQPSPNGYGFCAQRSAFSRVAEDTKDNTFWMKPDPNLIMPSKHYHTVWVDMPDRVRELDTQLRDEFGTKLDSGEKIETSYAASVFIKRQQLSGGVFSPADLYGKGEKADPVTLETNKIGIVQNIINQNPGSKIVVWHQYIAETDYLRREIESANDVNLFIYAPEYAHGKDELSFYAETRDNAVLLIRNSMCKGINQLADTDISIFYSNSFSYQKRSQAEGRARRLTSDNPETHYFDIVVRRSVDEVVYHMMEQKKSVSLTFGTLIGMIKGV
jgi:hypothetical protein